MVGVLEVATAKECLLAVVYSIAKCDLRSMVPRGIPCHPGTILQIRPLTGHNLSMPIFVLSKVS